VRDKENVINACKCSLKALEYMPLRRIMCVWTDNIRVGRKRVSFEAVDQIFVAEVSDNSAVHTVINILVL